MRMDAVPTASPVVYKLELIQDSIPFFAKFFIIYQLAGTCERLFFVVAAERISDPFIHLETDLRYLASPSSDSSTSTGTVSCSPSGAISWIPAHNLIW